MCYRVTCSIVIMLGRDLKIDAHQVLFPPAARALQRYSAPSPLHAAPEREAPPARHSPSFKPFSPDEDACFSPYACHRPHSCDIHPFPSLGRGSPIQASEGFRIFQQTSSPSHRIRRRIFLWDVASCRGEVRTHQCFSKVSEI